MELRHLRYFLAVAEDENFHRAAERLHIAQPALSRQIRALEQTVGVALFERLPRGIRLSAPGRAFLEDVRRILDEVAHAQERARRVAQGQVGTVRIGFNEIAARQPYLPGFFQAARTRFPDLDIKPTLLASQVQLDALHTDQIDAGFLFHRPLEDELLQAMRVDDDDYAIALPRTHRLAAKRKLMLADLRGEPFIMMSSQSNRMLYARLIAACAAGGLVPRQVSEANNEYAIVNLVAAGVGLAFLNRSFAAHPLPGVVLREPQDLSVPVQLELVWRRDDRSPALARFIETVSESEEVRRLARANESKESMNG